MRLYHRVCRIAWSQDDNGSVLDILDVAKEVVRIQHNVKRGAAIRQTSWEALWLGTPPVKVRGEELLCAVFRGVSYIWSDSVVCIRIRPRNKYRAWLQRKTCEEIPPGSIRD